MRGLVTGKDVLKHIWLVCWHFGPRCAWRCAAALVSRRPTTFLDVAFASWGGARRLPVELDRQRADASSKSEEIRLEPNPSRKAAARTIVFWPTWSDPR
jgi:hypothetical protein